MQGMNWDCISKQQKFIFVRPAAESLWGGRKVSFLTARKSHALCLFALNVKAQNHYTHRNYSGLFTFLARPLSLAGRQGKVKRRVKGRPDNLARVR
jgi:hypothetical protein